MSTASLAMTAATPSLLPTKEVAALLRTTPKAVYTMIERGLLPGVVRVGQDHYHEGNRVRYVPTTQRLAKALQQHRHLKSRRVLGERNGTPLTANAMSYLLERATRSAGLASGRKPKGAGPHVLRHTFCSHLAMKGAPARAIQELAGHRDLMTTQRYMPVSPVAVESAIRLLESPAVLPNRGDIVETADQPIANSNV